MGKTIVSGIIVALIVFSTGLPVYAQNYSFTSGADSSVFGKPTSDLELMVAPNPDTENIRRNKDAAYLPPAYGVFSGDIPTDPSSPYHDNSAPYSGISGSAAVGSYGGVSGAPTSTFPGGAVPDLPKVTVTTSEIPQPAAAYTPAAINTAPWYYDDRSIGTLKVHKTGATIKIYEGETLDNMKLGGAHFSSTSTWDGNVAIFGHNRGNNGYFGFLKNLSVGDELTYTTKYGTRTYEVINIEKISDTDGSRLGYSAENLLSLFTCVENVPSQRLCAIARNCY